MPAKWNFESAAALGNFMQDPSSVVRVEWRKVRRDQHRGWTSHSWLEAHLLDGRRMRLECFMDVGLTETILTADQQNDDSVIWDDLAASWTELERPLTVDRLRHLAVAASSEEYSVTESNCHQFVRDIWNDIVIERLRRSHYPDKLKTTVLWGASTSVGRLLFGFMTPLASLASVAEPALTMAVLAPPVPLAQGPAALMRLGPFSSCAARRPSSRPREHLGDESPLFPPAAGGATSSRSPPAHARLSARQEDGDRIAGELFVPVHKDLLDWALDRQFAEVVRTGLVFVLEERGELLQTKGTATTCGAWAEDWAPGAPIEARRLARLIAATDVVGLVQRILPPFAESPADALAAPSVPAASSLASVASVPASPAAGGPLSRLASLSLQSGDVSNRGRRDSHDLVADLRFVLLLGNEVRLAIYALLKAPARKTGRARRLRLLSGDVRAGKENYFAYTVCGLAQEDCKQTVADFVEEELEALRSALMWGEWGFVTLL